MAVLCLAAAGVGAAVIGTSFAATTLKVDDDGVQCPDAAYTSIQTAINAAANGDTIEVCPGTYTENLTLGKDLTLNGAQAGVDARTRASGPSESTVSSTGTLLTLIAGSANSTVDGFTFMGGTRGIESASGPISGLSLLNDRVVGFTGNGIFLNDTGIDITADQNVVDGTSKTGGGGLLHLDQDNFDGFRMTDSNIVDGATGTGLFVDGNHNVGPSPRTPLLDGNVFDGNATGANLGRFAFEFGDITGNTFSDSGFDGLQGGIQNSLIDGNEFAGNGRDGLALTGFGGTADPTRGAQNNTIENNEFTGNAEGIFFTVSQFPGTISTNTANQNNIVGNTVGVTYNGTETINVECNWWESASGPTATGNPGGTGDPAVGAGLDYTPWLIAPAPGGACLGPLPVPQTADECKKGGWENLTDDEGTPFKNQGDCVSYVQTGGQNKADG